MFHVELAPLGGILGPLKSDLGVFWAKIPLYPYNVKTQKTHFLKTLSWADFDLLESNCRHIFLHKNQKIYHSGFFFSWYIFSSHVSRDKDEVWFRLWAQSLVRSLKLKFRRDFEAEVSLRLRSWTLVKIMKLGLVKILSFIFVEMLMFGSDFKVNA